MYVRVLWMNINFVLSWSKSIKCCSPKAGMKGPTRKGRTDKDLMTMECRCRWKDDGGRMVTRRRVCWWDSMTQLQECHHRGRHIFRDANGRDLQNEDLPSDPGFHQIPSLSSQIYHLSYHCLTTKERLQYQQAPLCAGTCLMDLQRRG